MINVVILGKLSRQTADELAAPVGGAKPKAEDREKEIERILGHDQIGGAVRDVFWTLGDYDLVVIATVPSPEKAAAAALAISTRLGVGTTTLTGFPSRVLQDILDDSGKAGHG